MAGIIATLLYIVILQAYFVIKDKIVERFYYEIWLPLRPEGVHDEATNEWLKYEAEYWIVLHEVNSLQDKYNKYTSAAILIGVMTMYVSFYMLQ